MAFTWNENIGTNSNIDLSDVVEMRTNLDSVKDNLANASYDSSVLSYAVSGYDSSLYITYDGADYYIVQYSYVTSELSKYYRIVMSANYNNGG